MKPAICLISIVSIFFSCHQKTENASDAHVHDDGAHSHATDSTAAKFPTEILPVGLVAATSIQRTLKLYRTYEQLLNPQGC